MSASKRRPSRAASYFPAGLIDYRYRFNGPLAVGAVLGAARYALATPAYGFYYGAGVQGRDFPGWDLGAEFRFDD